MRTVAETPIFIRYAAEIWSAVEQQEFITFITTNPEAGAVIRGSGAVGKCDGRGPELENAAEPVLSTSWPSMKLYGC